MKNQSDSAFFQEVLTALSTCAMTPAHGVVFREGRKEHTESP